MLIIDTKWFKRKYSLKVLLFPSKNTLWKVLLFCKEGLNVLIVIGLNLPRLEDQETEHYI